MASYLPIRHAGIILLPIGWEMEQTRFHLQQTNLLQLFYQMISHCYPLYVLYNQMYLMICTMALTQIELQLVTIGFITIWTLILIGQKVITVCSFLPLMKIMIQLSTISQQFLRERWFCQDNTQQKLITIDR